MWSMREPREYWLFIYGVSQIEGRIPITAKSILRLKVMLFEGGYTEDFFFLFQHLIRQCCGALNRFLK